MNTIKMMPLANALKSVTRNGLNQDQPGVIDPGWPWPTLTRATVDSASSMTSSMVSSAIWKLADSSMPP